MVVIKCLAEMTKGEGLILAHSFRGVSPWLCGSVVKQNIVVARAYGEGGFYLKAGRKQRERKGLRTKDSLQGHVPKDQLYPNV